MKTLAAMVAFAFLAALCAAGTDAPAATGEAVTFSAVDVYVDSGATPLAAYQFELKVKSGNAKVVGVEGGEHAAFKAAPYYDPAALMGGRIIVAAFNTGKDLPKARTRVARLHMWISGAQPEYTVTLEAAASADGKPITAAISIAQGESE
jgi:hypothetical protein